MLNFTVGPVMEYERTKKIAGENSPYFRTKEFSEINLESEKLLKSLLKADDDCKCVFLTGSGTFGLECAIVNIVKNNDYVLTVNGGSFGQRFVNILNLYGVKNDDIKLEFGSQLKEEVLNKYAGKGYTVFCVNMDETSSGILYDMPLISKFCKENGIVLIVDAISAFICDDVKMSEWGIDCVITASQKAVAIQSGMSTLTLSQRALERVYSSENSINHSLYMDMKYALENQKRGQPSYTPCVSTFIQFNDRLKMLSETNNGEKFIETERKIIEKHANEIRSYIDGVSHYHFVAEDKSNCVTAVRTDKNNAVEIFETLKDKYNIWICPNGGEYAKSIFRIGHVGNITDDDNKALLKALKEIE